MMRGWSKCMSLFINVALDHTNKIVRRMETDLLLSLQIFIGHVSGDVAHPLSKHAENLKQNFSLRTRLQSCLSLNGK